MDCSQQAGQLQSCILPLLWHAQYASPACFQSRSHSCPCGDVSPGSPGPLYVRQRSCVALPCPVVLAAAQLAELGLLPEGDADPLALAQQLAKVALSADDRDGAAAAQAPWGVAGSPAGALSVLADILRQRPDMRATGEAGLQQLPAAAAQQNLAAPDFAGTCLSAVALAVPVACKLLML